MKKNVAGQFISVQMLAAADGAPFTGSVTVYITGNNGTRTIGSVGSGVCVHKGGGVHYYTPSQAETNYDHIAFSFEGTGALSATVNVFTAFPQTGDSFARIGATGTGLTSLASAASNATIITYVDEMESRLTAARAGYLDNLNGHVPQTGDAYAVVNSGVHGNSALKGLIDLLDANVDAILLDTGTDGVVVAGASKTGYALSAAGVDAVWDEVLSGHLTAGTVGKALNDAGASSSPSAIADAVWDEAISGHAVVGSTGAALAAAGGSGDPWATALPGSYGAGTAGNIIGVSIDAAISSRLATASYTAPNNAGIAAIPTNPLLTNDARLDALDATISSRFAAASYTAPDNAGITTLQSRLTVGRAANLDNLDAPVSGATAPTAGQVADAVWDEALSGHAIAGSAGAGLSAAGASGDPWSTVLPGSYGAGTAGKIIGDNINVPIDSRAAAADLPANPLLADDPRLDNLDTTVSSRLAASAYVPGGGSSSPAAIAHDGSIVYIPKKPGDNLDYAVDLRRWIPKGDTLLSATAAVDIATLTIGSSIPVVGTVASVWLSGGIEGATYTITVTATFQSGRKKVVEFKVTIV